MELNPVFRINFYPLGGRAENTSASSCVRIYGGPLTEILAYAKREAGTTRSWDISIEHWSPHPRKTIKLSRLLTSEDTFL